MKPSLGVICGTISLHPNSLRPFSLRASFPSSALMWKSWTGEHYIPVGILYCISLYNPVLSDWISLEKKDDPHTHNITSSLCLCLFICYGRIPFSKHYLSPWEVKKSRIGSHCRPSRCIPCLFPGLYWLGTKRKKTDWSREGLPQLFQ